MPTKYCILLINGTGKEFLIKHFKGSKYLYRTRLDSGWVAQSVEHPTSIGKDPGSSPSLAAVFFPFSVTFGGPSDLGGSHSG